MTRQKKIFYSKGSTTIDNITYSVVNGQVVANIDKHVNYDLQAITVVYTCTDVTDEAPSIEIGDYVEMGTYYDEPILWRCVDIDGNGPLMVSDKVICLKAFDAQVSANSTTGSHGRRGDGYKLESNYWRDSTMRSWLNSDAGAGNVRWLCGNPPIDMKVSVNSYDQEAGFLTNFTDKELSAVRMVTQKSIVPDIEVNSGIAVTGTESHKWNSEIDNETNTIVANYDDAYAEYVTDKMFLMDVKQVQAIYDHRDILGEYYHRGVLTEKCVAKSNYVDSNLVAGNYWEYWLRTPLGNDRASARTVGTGNLVDYESAYYGYYGVRPAFYLSDKAEFESGSGTADEPYTNAFVSEPEIKPEIEVTIDGDTITNTSDYAGEAAVITAYYDDSGALTNVTKETAILEARGSEGASYAVTATGEGERKIFVWNSLKGMKPLNISE